MDSPHPTDYQQGVSKTRIRSLAGISILGGLGIALLGLQISVVLALNVSLWETILASILPVMLACTMVVGGVAINYYGLEDHSLRISNWTIFGMLAFLLAAWIGLVYFKPNTVSVASLDLRIGVFNLVASGGLLGFLVGMYDAHHRHVTNQLNAEHQRVTTLYQRLDVINRVLRHDIRNRVNVIQGKAEVLESADSMDVVDIGREINEASQDLIRLSQRTRRIASTDSGTTGIQRVDLVSIVQEAITTVEPASWDGEIKTDLPAEAFVIAIPSLEVAIEELLRNSIEHTDTAPVITIMVSKDAGWLGGTAELVIADNGPGIPPEELAVIESGEETDLHHSSGLGLWIAKSVVDASTGVFKIKTSDNPGTTVHIRLPLAS